MKCPYNRIENKIEKYTYEYSPEGNMTKLNVGTIENSAFKECLKEGCAAWYNGHCNYSW